MAYQTLLFDLDETLYAYGAATIEALGATAATADLPVETLTQEILHHAKKEWVVRSPYSAYCLDIGISPSEGLWGRFQNSDPTPAGFAEWIPEYQQRVWLKALSAVGREDEALARQLSATFQVERRERHRIFPEVPALFAALGDRYQLGLVTNGASDLQREKVIGANLQQHFQTIVVSGEVGVGKPDSRVFTRALAALNATPEAAMMIGDSLRCDIRGAQAMGMASIWVCREPQTPPDPPADATISSLTELLQLLA